MLYLVLLITDGHEPSPVMSIWSSIDDADQEVKRLTEKNRRLRAEYEVKPVFSNTPNQDNVALNW